MYPAQRRDIGLSGHSGLHPHIRRRPLGCFGGFHNGEMVYPRICVEMEGCHMRDCNLIFWAWSMELWMSHPGLQHLQHHYG